MPDPSPAPSQPLAFQELEYELVEQATPIHGYMTEGPIDIEKHPQQVGIGGKMDEHVGFVTEPQFVERLPEIVNDSSAVDLCIPYRMPYVYRCDSTTGIIQGLY